MCVKKTALTAAVCLMGIAAFAQVYVIEPQNYSIPQGPDAQITTGATIPPAQLDLQAPGVQPPPQVPPSTTSIYSNFSDAPQPVPQGAPPQPAQPLYAPPPSMPQQTYAPPPRMSVYSNYPELPNITQQSSYNSPAGASPPQPSYEPPPRTSVYSNHSGLPYIMQHTTNGTSQPVAPPYGNLPYAAPPVPQQSYAAPPVYPQPPDSFPTQYQPPPYAQPYTPPPVQYQPPAPYPDPSVQFQPPPPVQYQPPYAPQPEPFPQQSPQQLPSSNQQLYAAPDAEFPRDFPPPAPAPASKTYRLQVGAFKSLVHAQYLYDTVSATGLSPALENTGDLYRVVVPYVPETNLHECVEILRAAGFAVWVREE